MRSCAVVQYIESTWHKPIITSIVVNQSYNYRMRPKLMVLQIQTQQPHSFTPPNSQCLLNLRCGNWNTLDPAMPAMTGCFHPEQCWHDVYIYIQLTRNQLMNFGMEEFRTSKKFSWILQIPVSFIRIALDFLKRQMVTEKSTWCLLCPNPFRGVRDRLRSSCENEEEPPWTEAKPQFQIHNNKSQMVQKKGRKKQRYFTDPLLLFRYSQLPTDRRRVCKGPHGFCWSRCWSRSLPSFPSKLGATGSPQNREPWEGRFLASLSGGTVWAKNAGVARPRQFWNWIPDLIRCFGINRCL